MYPILHSSSRSYWKVDTHRLRIDVLVFFKYGVVVILILLLLFSLPCSSLIDLISLANIKPNITDFWFIMYVGSVIICAYIDWTLQCIDVVQPANCQLFLLFGVQIKLRQRSRFYQLSHQGRLATDDGNVLGQPARYKLLWTTVKLVTAVVIRFGMPCYFLFQVLPFMTAYFLRTFQIVW
jgi:hypothetical protein